MFDYSYFCGANVKVTVISNNGDNGQEARNTLDIVGVNYSINYNPQPIYGYSSTYFNAVLKGRELAQGTLLLHSNFVSYFFKEITNHEIYEKFIDRRSNGFNLNLASLGSFDIKIEFGSEFEKTNSGVIIRDCFILNKGRNIQVSADAIVEEYGFFGREINTYNSKDEQKDTEEKERRANQQKENQNKPIESKPNTSTVSEPSAFNSFIKNLLKAKDLKIETNNLNPEESIAYNDQNNQSYSIDIKKEISLFNPETKTIAYSAPFYSRSIENKNKTPQKILNARLINDLLNALSRYGDKSFSNELFVKDRKALELILARDFKNVSDPVLKTKQINSVLWSQLNSLRNQYDLIVDNLDSPNLLEKDYKKNEAYIIDSGIQKIVNNFFNGNYSNNIGLCDKFFYEDSNEKPETILTNQNDPMYIDNMIFYLDLNLAQVPIATNIYFQDKKNKYKEYYKQLWDTTPNFIKG